MMTASSLSCGGACFRSHRWCRSERPARRCVQVRAAAHQDVNDGLYSKVGKALIAATLWTSFTFAAPDHFQLDARASDRNTTALNKRLEETQRRKDLLTQAREKALAKGGSLKAIEAGEMQDPEVVAANEKVEEANAKRQQESERSMQALQSKSADTYNKQSTVKGPGLKGVSYSVDLASAFDFLDPPAPLSVPKDSTPSPPVDPSNVMNNSSSSPMPSALAPSPSKQQEGSSGEESIGNPFAGLLDSITTESASDKASDKSSDKSADKISDKSSEVPDQFLQKDKESRPTATEPPPGPFRPVNPAARTYLVQELPAPKKGAKAGVQESTNQVAKTTKKDNKRRGPLPLFLAQLLVLVAYGGAGFLAFQKDEETRKAIAIFVGLLQKGFSKVQSLIPSGGKA